MKCFDYKVLKTISSRLQVSSRRLVPVRKRSSSVEVGTESAVSMELSNVVKRFHQFASPGLAESWDNVGLLVEPSPPHTVNTILLTNDLTPPVLDEALALKADMVISYHPPIFTGLKRLCQRDWKERTVVRCLENRLAVYSPHTSLDCVAGGVNDWLLSCFDCESVEPVEQYTAAGGDMSHVVRVDLPRDSTLDLREHFHQHGRLVDIIDREDERTWVTLHCAARSLPGLISCLQSLKADISNLQITELAKVPRVGYGMGRRGRLSQSVSVEAAVNLVKSHLGLNHVRLARAPGAGEVLSVAVCAGSGAGVLRGVSADMYVTGEMSHHDVLHAVHNGTSVILCDHSNTERGYFSLLKTRLHDLLNSKTKILLSEVDSDPLKIV
ncbi:NIF3-like protein 1 isoform X2 [Mya arenaria]|nr:NIF3-like protein 1 isoform X2 [Mya arenaria]XP_052800164.1 NIF3-like protein 1 isoform X2 [Mya arenaria]XP_052800165.1 NIF3-like protein 1 isoform X2 [Mya arenaria]